jgi:hypothetical protein
LFGFLDRWILYRSLEADLMSAAWALINAQDAAAWHPFVAATDAAVARYNSAYRTEVLTATSARTEVLTATSAKPAEALAAPGASPTWDHGD